LLIKALAAGVRPDRRVGLLWLMGAAVDVPVLWFIYWY
jgi:hypothetical protein